MDFFNLLREHARLRTESPAVSSPRRSMTYRKLWSRIERATARLQCEWGVSSNDTVAYLGNSHPDALVLFFSLARCGARLLPISPELAPSVRASLFQAVPWQLLIVDDDLSHSDAADSQLISSLIATRCPHEPRHVVEDMSRPLLVCSSGEEGMQWRTFSLAALQEEGRRLGQISLQPEISIGSYFEGKNFPGIVLPVLEKGQCLVLP